MKRTQAFSRNKVSLAISLAAASFSLCAQESRLAYGPQGVPVFETRFFDVGDGPYMTDGDTAQVSTWNLSGDQKSKIQKAIEYWATVIRPAPGAPIAVVNVGTNNEDNAGGASDSVQVTETSALTAVQAALIGRNDLVKSLDYGSHAQFQMGNGLTYDSIAYLPSQQPRSTNFDLSATALHELAHGLGVTTYVADKNGSGSKTPYFQSSLGSWEEHMRDDNGNPAQPGQAVLCSVCATPYDPAGFDLRQDNGYVTGKHVDEVLAGAMPGVPVRILSLDGTIDTDYMAHIELKNSLMSHQNYRNYTTFMEAELAALQDLGYQIDRRNFFGYSVYGDGQTLYNQHGYYQRNAEGTDYLVGAYSNTLMGLGLHVYGNNNLIFQQANLLTRGAGAAGVRIDGEGNTLIVEPGTRIHADGLNGRGVLFAYGMDHNFIQRGDVEALGDQGIAAEFNFGNNLVGNKSEYRGSFIRTEDGSPSDLLPELEGALVDNVDISGRLAGKAAAISISSNALVNTLNVLSGAKLEGNILSAYDQEDDNGNQRLTQLTFGRLADSQGRATNQADPNFRMTYNGDIQGITNFALNLRGGVTSLGGHNQVYSMEVAEGATLAGNGYFKLNEDGSFVNRGTVAPGNSIGSITVDGNYQQTDSGQLLVEVNDKGAHDSLVVKGNADLAGRLTVSPQRGWYSPQWKISSSQLLAANSTTGAFDEVQATPISPTMSLLATPQINGSQLLSFNRTSDAYSQYATSKNGRNVGEALSETTSSPASTDRQNLYTALDFSNPDGSTIARALEQLSPSAYSAMMASSLQREQQVADAISAREPGKLRDDEWQTFIQPFGGNSRQNSDHDAVGYTTDSYGVIFGAETAASSDGALIVGLHGAASKQNLSLKDPQRGDGDTTALELGAHVRYALDPMAGTYWLGSARVGYENGELKRKIDFDDYSARNKADWTGKSASVVGGGGYRFQLNENVSLGPIATLTYTSLWRDGTHEKGADGSALKLKSQQFDSLRSSVGLNSAMNFPLEGGRAIKAEGQVTWNHELLNTDLIQDATFATYQGSSFRSKNTVMDRDSMGLRGNIRYSLSENVDIGAGVASDLFRTGYNSVSGNLSLDWRF
ncbi:autotransporter domain-containing protein [Pseudomonas sp. PDM23]|uniref:autotransporter outer membrane beta-barrel domain-containing protein n=1 Tax=unclassified Pseudomonas TaxID=196821 RepID=UPI001784D430|nr:MULTISPECIES: autotransporter outer membrane beta-barrel domain-containing protein [unclassified Pseudomonas]MBD9577879.1 autotransporter domain-containing protein [Pseudomonas sp. PDM23]MBD9672437.1 autotransporter domain-containing protein [Pseudomonas sp. PDM21]